ncbi:hypothetical protein MUY14_07335 [Amycolatopsis sp. FBCC-B4732]|uniref:hypothetical protein n=1 Tax=Amycolatopsis sp. FBCC-B4732 TaxID=3079339 RepID=UPI001FF4241D|nr:hypothetical protein [Amycolatopsis sp. FBCC-B4732]UOX90428.1 hypothetical protein MUY14_07335 [Amycolatopsis sp. FBCC-B4732]
MIYLIFTRGYTSGGDKPEHRELQPATDADTNAAVDAAYTEKCRSQASALEPIVAETAATTTVRLEPA